MKLSQKDFIKISQKTTCSHCNYKKSDKNPEDFAGNSWKIWDRYYRANKIINPQEINPQRYLDGIYA